MALLDEPLSELKSFALKKLLSPYDSASGTAIVDVFWPEISDSLQTIERLHEDDHFQDRQMAALVASKVSIKTGSDCICSFAYYSNISGLKPA